jgi:O-acetyl-ADP-ribose deacetylase (regulator of RNase III)
MDILLIQASAYELPTSRRVDVIVHDGATNARLWPGPGADRELLAAYGPDVQSSLDRELDKAPDEELPIGELLRVHPGRLHCDFLVWIATRPPEDAGRQAPAPERATIAAAVRTALEFVAERHVVRVAFPALGGGPGAVDDAERLAIIARACSEWYDQRFASGRPSQIEEVLICDPRLSTVTTARRMVSQIVKTPAADPRAAAAAPAKPERRTVGERKPAGERKTGGTRASAASKKPRLDEAELGHARATARPWDRTVRYHAGSWFIHAKFGVGRVQEISPDGFAVILFEDGEIRKLIHARG